jgi:hypothetical protein
MHGSFLALSIVAECQHEEMQQTHCSYMFNERRLVYAIALLAQRLFMRQARCSPEPRGISISREPTEDRGATELLGCPLCRCHTMPQFKIPDSNWDSRGRRDVRSSARGRAHRSLAFRIDEQRRSRNVTANAHGH